MTAVAEALEELERRVAEKWAAATAARTPEWPLPDVEPIDFSDWQMKPLPPDWPQFPREKWATYPVKRIVTLMICDRSLDMADRMTAEQWFQVCFLMQYGGKTQLS